MNWKKVTFVLALLAGLCGGGWAQNWGRGDGDHDRDDRRWRDRDDDRDRDRVRDRDRWRHRRGDGDHDWDDGYRNRNWGYGPNRTWGYSPNGTYYPYAGQRAGVTVTAPVICTLESASPALSRISLGGLPLLPDANHPPRPRH